MGRRATVPTAAALLIFGCTCTDPKPAIPPMTKAKAPLDLGFRAYGHVQTLVNYGPRHVGSKGWKQAIDFIMGELTDMGLEPRRDEWFNGKEQLSFTNISVTLKGTSKDKIVIGCHHDTKKCVGHHDPAHNFRFVGANDSGSGVGLLIELARILKNVEHVATYEFVFFDGEESLPWDWDKKRALFGSKRYVRHYVQARFDEPENTPIIQAFILIDMVGAKDLQIDEETNSDKELRDIFYAAAKANGHEKYFYVDSLPVTDDHTPFLDDTKVRCINLIDFEDNPHWHKASDALEHISADSLHLVGEVVLTALPAIETRFIATTN